MTEQKFSLKRLQAERPILLFISCVAIFAVLSAAAAFIDYQLYLASGNVSPWQNRWIQIILNCVLIGSCFLFFRTQAPDYCLQRKSRRWYLELLLLLPLLQLGYSKYQLSWRYYYIDSPFWDSVCSLLFLFSTVFALIMLTVWGVYMLRGVNGSKGVRFIPMLAAPVFYIILFLLIFLFGLFDASYSEDVMVTFLLSNQVSFSSALVASVCLSFFGVIFYYRYHNFTRVFFISVFVIGFEFYSYLMRFDSLDSGVSAIFVVILFIALLPCLIFAFYQYLKKKVISAAWLHGNDADEDSAVENDAAGEDEKPSIKKESISVNQTLMYLLMVVVFAFAAIVASILDVFALEEYSVHNLLLLQVVRTIVNILIVVFCCVLIKKQEIGFRFQKKKRKIWLDVILSFLFLIGVTVRFASLESKATGETAIICLSSILASLSSILAAVFMGMLGVCLMKKANKGFAARIWIPVLAVSLFYIIYSLGTTILLGYENPEKLLPMITTLPLTSMLIMPIIIAFVGVVFYYRFHDYIKVFMISYFMILIESLGYCVDGYRAIEDSMAFFYLIPTIPFVLIALFSFRKLIKNKQMLDAPFIAPKASVKKK